MPIPGRKYIVVQYEKDRVVTQAEKDRIVEQSDHSKLKGITKLTDGTHEISAIHDYKTGKTCLIVSRAAGKVTFTEVYGSNQTNEDIITPASGKRLCIASAHVSM
ncbi:unnamed protein product, partial [marine sediment metagenome]